MELGGQERMALWARDPVWTKTLRQEAAETEQGRQRARTKKWRVKRGRNGGLLGPA